MAKHGSKYGGYDAVIRVSVAKHGSKMAVTMPSLGLVWQKWVKSGGYDAVLRVRV